MLENLKTETLEALKENGKTTVEPTNYIYGRMYGAEYRTIVTKDGIERKLDEIIRIGVEDLKIINGAMIFRWGMGAEVNIYSFADYGKTWAFRLEDFERREDG